MALFPKIYVDELEIITPLVYRHSPGFHVILFSIQFLFGIIEFTFPMTDDTVNSFPIEQSQRKYVCGKRLKKIVLDFLQ